MRPAALLLFAGCGLLLLLAEREGRYLAAVASAEPGQPSDARPIPAPYRRAAEYSAAARGVSVLVMREGVVVFEDYPNGGGADRAWELASGTKSFTGLMAVAAIDDGFLTWGEPVSATIHEWASDPSRARITVSQLLSLTSGIEPGGLARPPSYTDAVKTPASAPAGARFQYGPAPFQIFGELMRRKLERRGGGTPLDYLRRRVLDPIGVKPGRWRRDAQGQPHMPSGASLTARDWARVGELVRLGGRWQGKAIVSGAELDRLFVGSDANPMYGLSWWLLRTIDPSKAAAIPMLRRATDLRTTTRGLPDDLVFAGGAGGQRLYVSRKLGLVVVRQATGILAELLGRDESRGFSDAAFLGLLLADPPA